MPCMLSISPFTSENSSRIDYLKYVSVKLIRLHGSANWTWQHVYVSLIECCNHQNLCCGVQFYISIHAPHLSLMRDYSHITNKSSRNRCESNGMRRRLITEEKHWWSRILRHWMAQIYQHTHTRLKFIQLNARKLASIMN